jgi:hypothetical protein
VGLLKSRSTILLLSFVSLSAYGQSKVFDKVTVDNLVLDGNTISSKNTNGDIVLNPNGTGGVQLFDQTVDTVAVVDGSQRLVSSPLISTTELNLLDGLTDLLSSANTKTLTNKTINADDNTITNIDNNEIRASAGIAVNKLAATTASRALVSDGSGFISASATTATQVGYLSTTTSDVQTQLDARQTRSVLTTKGDLYAATASNTVTRLGVGADGTVLTASAAQPTGMIWQAPASPTTYNYSSGAVSGTSQVVNCDTTSSNVTVSLPAVASAGTGRWLIIHKPVAANTCTIDPNASELVGGLSTLVMRDAGDTVFIVNDTTAWRVMGTYGLDYTLDTRSINSSVTATKWDNVFLCDATGGNVTVTLPAAASSKGVRFHLKKTDASGNSCIFDGNASETIDGATTSSLTTQYSSRQIVCDGTGWQVL